MPYSDENDLLLEFSYAELSNLCGGSYDVLQLRKHRDYADSIINSNLNSRYQTPLSMPDTLVNKLSVDITIAYLYDYAYTDAGVPNTVVWRKLNAFQLLKDIKNEKVDLPNQIEKDIAIEQALIITNSENKTITFEKETLDDFKEYLK